MFTHEDEVMTPAGAGVLKARDNSQRFWLVQYADGSEQYWNQDVIKPAEPTEKR